MSGENSCQVTYVHKDKVARIKQKALSVDEIKRLSGIFKALGDPTRIQILNALFEDELCVCDLVEILGMTQSAISHQLGTLRKLHLVKYRKQGRMVFYSVDDEHIYNLFSQSLSHIRHS